MKTILPSVPFRRLSKILLRQLYVDVAPLFSDNVATLVCLSSDRVVSSEATFYSNGACEANYWFEFSAAPQNHVASAKR
jgi:hypothetical protein